jgi:precorrin-2 dehydrogenase/sirohydrochlorin ferrochelatase
MSSLLPMFFKLAGRRCLVVGAGAAAEPKIEGLLRAGGETLVIAPKATPKIKQWATEGKLRWWPWAFHPADLDGKFLVIAATSSAEINELVFKEAREKNVLCNVVDDPEHCDFHFSAVVQRGPLQIAISTGGLCPPLAQRIRQDLEQQFGIEYEAWLEQLDNTSRELLATPMDPVRRLVLLHSLASREGFKEFVRRRFTRRIPA